MLRTALIGLALFTGVGVLGTPQANADPTKPFKNCSAAKAAGYCDIPSNSPMYTPSQDRDDDGVACEC